MASSRSAAARAFLVLAASSVLNGIYDVWLAFNPGGHPGSPWLGAMLVLGVLALGHLVLALLAWAASSYVRSAPRGRRRTAFIVASGTILTLAEIFGLFITLLFRS